MISTNPSQSGCINPSDRITANASKKNDAKTSTKLAKDERLGPTTRCEPHHETVLDYLRLRRVHPGPGQRGRTTPCLEFPQSYHPDPDQDRLQLRGLSWRFGRQRRPEAVPPRLRTRDRSLCPNPPSP